MNFIKKFNELFTSNDYCQLIEAMAYVNKYIKTNDEKLLEYIKKNNFYRFKSHLIPLLYKRRNDLNYEAEIDHYEKDEYGSIFALIKFKFDDKVFEFHCKMVATNWDMLDEKYNKQTDMLIHKKVELSDCDIEKFKDYSHLINTVNIFFK